MHKVSLQVQVSYYHVIQKIHGFSSTVMASSVISCMFCQEAHQYALVDMLLISCGVLQVSNHVAAMDDPFVIASLLPPNVMLDARNLRWTLCATDRCFSNPVLSAFFQCVKVLPVSRGEGIYQKVSYQILNFF